MIHDNNQLQQRWVFYDALTTPANESKTMMYPPCSKNDVIEIFDSDDDADEKNSVRQDVETTTPVEVIEVEQDVEVPSPAEGLAKNTHQISSSSVLHFSRTAVFPTLEEQLLVDVSRPSSCQNSHDGGNDNAVITDNVYSLICHEHHESARRRTQDEADVDSRTVVKRTKLNATNNKNNTSSWWNAHADPLDELREDARGRLLDMVWSSGQQNDRQHVTFFGRQQAAFDFRRQEQRLTSQQLFVWSLEPSSRDKGTRRALAARYYAVSSAHAMWAHIKETLPDPLDRHVYEVIEENEPCHLYFDLECPRDVAEAHGITVAMVVNGIVDIMNGSEGQRQHVVGWGSGVDDLSIANIEPHDVVVLESTPSPKKFSLHVVIPLPNGAMWPNNIVAGAYVAATVQPKLKKRLGGGIDVVDMCVYSRNRSFRCAFCCKLGKGATFVLSGEYPSSCWDERDVFFKSLITRQGCATVMTPPRLVEYVGCPQVSAAAKTTCGAGASAAHDPAATKTVISCPSSATGFHPLLDAFITATIGEFRSCLHKHISNTVCYSLKNTRFCGNIGREHKSNGTYIQVSLSTFRFCQRCHDYECRAYRGPEVDLPLEIVSALKSSVAENSVQRINEGG
eukprot:PhM_4_TR9557/c0_g1_i1/m.38207